MTALVVIVTGAWDNPDAGSGVITTAWAFQTEISWFPVLWPLASFSSPITMISWSYYGEKCLRTLGRTPTVSLIYKGIFLVYGHWLGRQPRQCYRFLRFNDFSMAFPNIIGGLISGTEDQGRAKSLLGKSPE